MSPFIQPGRRLVLSIALLALAGCLSLPNGPNIPVMPGTGKSFEHFRDDDAICRAFGTESIGAGAPHEAGERSAVKSALTGAAVGAAAGVALGGGQGAAIGAGSGLLLGSAAGAPAGAHASRVLQQRYDNSYMQCMYAKGNQVPGSGPLVASPSAAPYPPPPPGYSPLGYLPPGRGYPPGAPPR